MTENQAGGAAVLTGSVALVVVTAIGVLWLDNEEGPMPDHPRLGGLLAFGTAVLVACVVVAVTWWLAHRSRVLLGVLVVAVCAGGVVLLPREVDVSESFVPQPNARWSCTGWSFRHYPPQTFDASATTYCVGLEHRIADG